VDEKSKSTKSTLLLTAAECGENYRVLFARRDEGFALHELIYDGNGNAVDYRFLDVNPTFQHLIGLSREDVVGRAHNECLPAENPIFLQRYAEVVRSGVPAEFEAPSILGSEYKVFAYKFAEHKFGVIFSDITEEKRDAAHLAWLASIPENNPRQVIEIDALGQIIYQNKTARHFGVPSPSGSMTNRLLKDIPENFSELCFDENQTKHRDIQIGDRWYRQSLLYLPEIQHLRVYSMEITDQVEAQQALQSINMHLEELVTARTMELQEANRIVQEHIEQTLAIEQASIERERQQFQDLINLLPAYLVVLSPDREIVMSNQYFRDQFGDSDGMKCYQSLFRREEPCEICESFKPFEENAEHQWEWEGPNGRIYEVYDFPFVQDETMMILELGIDITKTKQAQQHLDQLNRYNRSIIESNMDTLMTVTRLGKMGDVNAAAVAITGMSREELIGSDFLDLFSDSKGTLRAIKAVREQGKVRDFELELKTYDGKVIPVALNATIFKNQDIPASKLASNNNITENYADDNVEIFASIKDLTEFKRKEQELKKLNKELEDLIAKDMIIHEQLVHAEKLAALGRMLASITHEINNPLQTIKNSLYLIEADTAPDNPAVEYLQIAATETERISKLVAQLREIYRPSRTLTDATFDLVSVVEQVQALVSGELEKGRVEWVLERPRIGEWEVRGEKDQIKQVFINICINAIEAMQPKGGRLEISFRQGPPASHEVGVIVRDHGPGIPAEYLDKLLEPFQTTKPKGGGLGLAISYEIVQRHKGRLSAYNYGDGAEFSVWLPSIDKKE